MTGTVLQINVSPGGLPKRAIAEGRITPLGIAGDVQAHPGIHGGPRKAVLIVAEEAISSLKQLGYAVYPGALGENLTTRGLDPTHFRAGQVFRIGAGVRIELTQPRQPCKNLDVYGPAIKGEIFDPRVKAGDVTSPHWGLGGFYASVIHAGIVKPGDTIELFSELA